MDQKVTETNTTPAVPAPVVQTTRTTESSQVVTPGKGYEKKKVIFRLYQIIWYIVGLIEVLLIFRVVLKALAANAVSSFVSLVYALSDPLALPFAGVFGTTVTKGSVFEWSTIVGGVVYFIIGYGLVRLMQLVKPADPQQVVKTVDSE